MTAPYRVTPRAAADLNHLLMPPTTHSRRDSLTVSVLKRTSSRATTVSHDRWVPFNTKIERPILPRRAPKPKDNGHASRGQDQHEQRDLAAADQPTRGRRTRSRRRCDEWRPGRRRTGEARGARGARPTPWRRTPQPSQSPPHPYSATPGRRQPAKSPCGVCGGTLRVITCIETPEVIERILTHLAARNTACSDNPAHRRCVRPEPNSRPPHHRRCSDFARGCTTAPLRLASCAPRPPPPS